MGIEETEAMASSLSLRDFILVLRRRKVTALITFATVMGLIILITLLTKPQYRATASLMLEDQNNSSRTADIGGLAGIFAPQAGMAVDSQVELINSPLILDRVYKETNLKPESVTLTVERVDKTNVIDLIGVSNDKEGVEKFLANVPRIYQENRRMESAREVTSQLNFASKDLEDENKKLLDTEASIASFKTANNLIDPESEVAQALKSAADSRALLEKTQAEVSSLRAQIGALEGQLSGMDANIETPVITTNPLVRELRNDLAALKSKRQEQSFLYKDNADPIRQLDLQIATLERRIANTSPTITNVSRSTNPAVAALREQVATARADYSAKVAAANVLQEQVAKQDNGLGRYTEIQRRLQVLQRQLEASRLAVKAGGENVSQLSVRSKALQAAGAPVTLLESGTEGKKIAPRPTRNLIMGLFLGTLLACGAALLQDSLDDRVRDEEEARQMLGAPVLGYFPLLPVSDERQILDVNSPDRLLLEMFRALRSNVQFALVNSTGKKLQVTSTVPNEGKSYIASNLAITMAMDGRRVILVDADLHRPTMHERFGGSRQPGLTNVLVGESKLEDALQDVGINGLQLLSAGALPPNPAELLNSPAMIEVMNQLEGLADLIIFDTPPLLATSDSQLMSAKMDGVVFVMQMGSVARSGTMRAFELLKQAHANLVGVVFNKVDATQSSVGYENYSGYYALESTVSDDEVLQSAVKKLPPDTRDASHDGSSNGTAKNGSNGSHPKGAKGSNGKANGQATVFDEAMQNDENSR